MSPEICDALPTVPAAVASPWIVAGLLTEMFPVDDVTSPATVPLLIVTLPLAHTFDWTVTWFDIVRAAFAAGRRVDRHPLPDRGGGVGKDGRAPPPVDRRHPDIRLHGPRQRAPRPPSGGDHGSYSARPRRWARDLRPGGIEDLDAGLVGRRAGAAGHRPRERARQARGRRPLDRLVVRIEPGLRRADRQEASSIVAAGIEVVEGQRHDGRAEK